ncbi:MAG: putative manganese-dependent inorganic diphosphatase [Coriobacteriia bacterium]
MDVVLVFGHRNPDNDSVCSAVAYAHLKNVTDPGRVYIPAKLGPMPPESSWAFARFGVEPPAEVDHVRTRVRDVMTADIVTVAPETTMRDAGRLMRERGVRVLPVVEGEAPVGVLNVEALAARYVEDMELAGFASRPVRVAQLVSALDGRLLAGDPESVLAGAVLIGAMEPETMLARCRPGDTLVVGDRRRTQPQALEAGIACLVVSGGCEPDAAVLDLARAKGAAVIATAHDTYSSARLIELGRTAGEVMDDGMVVCGPDDLLTEVAEDLLGSPHREAVVVDGGRLVGVLTRTDLAKNPRRSVVLVDHNEAAQSASGIEEATVVEIVDHHRVGDIETAGPILFLGLPFGATATVVARRYDELGVAVPEPIAGLLLAAVLTDTVLLKSPTTTDADREVAARLGDALGLDPLAFGMEVFRARSMAGGFSPRQAVMADLKEYRGAEAAVAIGQVETVDAADVLAHRAELLEVMEGVLEARRLDLVALMVTDVVREGSELLAVGRVRLVERGFGVTLAGGSAWLPGVLSRKKQVAPLLVGR